MSWEIVWPACRSAAKSRGLLLGYSFDWMNEGNCEYHNSPHRIVARGDTVTVRLVYHLRLRFRKWGYNTKLRICTAEDPYFQSYYLLPNDILRAPTCDWHSLMFEWHSQTFCCPTFNSSHGGEKSYLADTLASAQLFQEFKFHSAHRCASIAMCLRIAAWPFSDVLTFLKKSCGRVFPSFFRRKICSGADGMQLRLKQLGDTTRSHWTSLAKIWG